MLFRSGVDGITAEHLLYGESRPLLQHLAILYSTIITYGIVPDVFKTGIIVPILKKSTLNPNLTENYRPITLSSAHAKLVELFILPEDKVSDAQLGFRKGRSASFGCTFLHDLISYFNSNGSPVYVCALDAQKCFDSVWHDGLLFKLLNILPENQWLLIYEWYKNSYNIVRWNGEVSYSFPITRGVRQGSVISPYFFIIYR